MNDSKEATNADVLDQQVRAIWAQVYASLSPNTNMLAWMDWATHMAHSPGKQLELAQLAQTQAKELLAPPPSPDTDARKAPLTDRRFNDPAWGQWPFNLWQQTFLQTKHWWEQATQDVKGVEQHHLDLVAFSTSQWLEMLSPTNFPQSNPTVLQRTREEGGANLQRGLEYLMEDLQRLLHKQPPVGCENFQPGREVATTPGKVVLKNQVMELLQYTPTTDQVYPEPILIVPAWIMKYYVMDLSAHNSLIKYLVDQGHTVFCISWKNPGIEERNLDMDDYLEQGFHAALDAVNAIVPRRKVHAAGYCLGGTLLSIAAAAMARDGGIDRLASMSLLAAQTDFSEPGELKLFIDENQVSLLEAQMASTGYLTAEQMSAAFQMLRPFDLLWSPLVTRYLLGERQPVIDLMAWNADGTRMPAKMHSQYLRRLYLNNELGRGVYPVDEGPVSLGDLRLPTFSVGTLTDHVAPWQSVYKLHYLSPAEITFVLTSGGHNAGIISEPGRPRRHFQIHTRSENGYVLPPDEWAEQAERMEGSWWPQWGAWLQARSSETQVKPPRMGVASRGYKATDDAPGTYVLER